MPFGAELVEFDGKQASAVKTLVHYIATNFTGVTTEALLTVTPVRDGVNGTNGSSFVIPSGKRFVLLNMTLIVVNAGAAIQSMICRLRHNPAGATIATSPVMAQIGCGTSAAIASVADMTTLTLSQGWPSHYEIQGDGVKTIGISQIGTATAGNHFSLIGYEY